MNALEIRNLSKAFGTNKVLESISFSVPENSVFGFIGANGAGKTTTMKIILGLLKADGGEIDVYGQRVSFGQTSTNRMLGYLPDIPEFYGYMRPQEYLKLCSEIVGLNRQVAAKRITQVLDLVGLAGSNKKIAGFSRGMKQRLGVAQALLGEPLLLICDEPTSALDPLGRKQILDILHQIKGQTTVVFSTHILSDVERICDRVAVLNKGKIVLESAIADLKLPRKTKTLSLEFENEVEPDTVVRVLRENDLPPVKFETAEKSIESLLLEVVK